LNTQSKIVVTGGAGFIGSHTVVELVKAGFEPIIIDDFSNSEKRALAGIEQILGRKITHYQLNCAEKETFEYVFEKEKDIKGIIHFAAFKAVGESVQFPLKYYKNNLFSTIYLLEAMKKYQIKNLVFSSSCTVYGQPDELPVTEMSPIKVAESPYGNTKQICEEFITDFLKSENTLKAVLLRYFNPIGAHESALIGELPLGVPNNLVPFITQTAAGIRKQLTVYGNDYNTPDGSCIRDYIHVVDLAIAHVKSIGFMLDKQMLIWLRYLILEQEREIQYWRWLILLKK
jgi:UDP-glucose 4-epimerase